MAERGVRFERDDALHGSDELGEGDREARDEDGAVEAEHGVYTRRGELVQSEQRCHGGAVPSDGVAHLARRGALEQVGGGSPWHMGMGMGMDMGWQPLARGVAPTSGPMLEVVSSPASGSRTTDEKAPVVAALGAPARTTTEGSRHALPSTKPRREKSLSSSSAHALVMPYDVCGVARVQSPTVSFLST